MSEKIKIISKILSLYLITSALFLGYFFTNDYKMKKEAMVSNEVKNLKEIKMGIYMKAKMNGFDDVALFTREKGVSACIFSKDGKTIYEDTNCTDAKAQEVFVKDGKVAIFEALQNMETNSADELSKADIVLFGKDIQSELTTLKLKTFLNLFIILAILMIIAFYLAKLSLKPLYNQIDTLNRFIKDSTHEINTPLSIIMMSIETTDKENLSQRNLKRINNIDLAAKTLSNIYEDLVYLSFNKRNKTFKEDINFQELLKERIEFFAPFFAKRSINLSVNLENSTIYANIYEIKRMIDNLISNAVKYSNISGSVSVNLTKDTLSITNSGEGISKEQQKKMFDRYTRFNNDQGGFGIGLNLVKKVCENNDIQITCQSELGKDTTFELKWSLLPYKG